MNIVELLHDLGIPSAGVGEHHHAREGWVQTDCPWCSPHSGKFRFGFHLSGLHGNCWSCGPARVWDTIAALVNEPVKHLVGKLKALETTPYKEREHQGRLQLPNRIGPLLKPHRQYLRERGFEVKQIQRLWKVKGIDHTGGNLAWRIFIPVLFQGDTVSWTTRSIASQINADTVIRYITAKTEQSALPRTKILYGEDYVRWAIAVVEGPTDVWAIGPGAVATLGTGFSQDQLARMVKYPVRAVIFDNEREAQKRADKLVDALCQFPGQTYNIVLESKDAATASKQDIQLIRKQLFGD